MNKLGNKAFGSSVSSMNSVRFEDDNDRDDAIREKDTQIHQLLKLNTIQENVIEQCNGEISQYRKKLGAMGEQHKHNKEAYQTVLAQLKDLRIEYDEMDRRVMKIGEHLETVREWLKHPDNEKDGQRVLVKITEIFRILKTHDSDAREFLKRSKSVHKVVSHA